MFETPSHVVEERAHSRLLHLQCQFKDLKYRYDQGAPLLVQRTLPQNFSGSSPIRFLSIATCPEFGPDEEPSYANENDLAYIIFTPDTSGIPKGVMVTAGTVAQSVSVMQRRNGFRPVDRVSQAPELTVDVSAFDMFMTCWRDAMRRARGPVGGAEAMH